MNQPPVLLAESGDVAAQPESARSGSSAQRPAASGTHPRAHRSFVLRAGRTTSGQSRAREEFGPEFLIPYQSGFEALAQVYPQLAARGHPAAAPGISEQRAVPPLVLEIGFGMGEATAHIAELLPDTQFLCCEVHPPGVGALLKRIGQVGLKNVRIIAHDAVEVIDHMLPVWRSDAPERGLDGVHVFFPDPWHKKRHNKRRLLQAPLVARLAALLKPGAYLHCATDWEDYAQQMLRVLDDEPLLVNRNTARHPALGGYAPRPDYRPLTKFERRGIGLGHGVWDLVFHRV